MTGRPITKQRRYKNPKSIVRAAKRLIDTGHWEQGSWARLANGVGVNEDAVLKEDIPALGGGVCTVCLEGALALCSYDAKAYKSAEKLVSKAVPTFYRDKPLFVFNDVSRRTRSQVSAVLEKALLAK